MDPRQKPGGEDAFVVYLREALVRLYADTLSQPIPAEWRALANKLDRVAQDRQKRNH
jgi:hypothetical protein